MSKLELELPLTVSVDEARLLLAIKLYETERVSLGKAAEIAGYSVPIFIDLLCRYKVPVVCYTPEELQKEVER